MNIEPYTPLRQRVPGKPVSVDLPKIAIRQIIADAADIFEVGEREITGPARMRYIVRARQAVCRVAFDHGWSLTIIARILNRCDHSTILYARDQVDIHVPRDPQFASRYYRLAKLTDERLEQRYSQPKVLCEA